MFWRQLGAIGGLVALAGCIQSVAIPQQESALKDACHGKDRPMAGVAGYSVWRCGEGDKARYGIYNQGALVKEANELEAAQAAAGFACIGRGLKLKTPEFAACAQGVGQTALSATTALRSQEEAIAEEKRRQALIATSAALSAASASIAASQAASEPQTVRVQANCTSSRLGNFVNTNCF